MLEHKNICHVPKKTKKIFVFSNSLIFIDIKEIIRIKNDIKMNKRRIKLTESDLHNIIKESVNKILNESITFNEVDPDGGAYYSEADETIYDIENGYYDEDIKHMNVKELDDWVYDMKDISTRVGETAIKRATMVNKQYAMSNKRENRGKNSLSYNDYRSSNFYKGPVSQANAVGKPTPFGMEDLETRWKYGEQKDNRPDVRGFVN